MLVHNTQRTDSCISQKFKERIKQNIEESMYQNFILNEINDHTALVKVNLERAVIESAVLFNRYVEKLITSNHKHYILDFSKTLFMDSTFLGSIIVFQKKLNKMGGSLKLIINSEKLILISEISCLRQFMKIYPSLEEAISSINAEQLIPF